jgi:hypothetical protein
MQWDGITPVLFLHRVKYSVASDLAVIPAKLVLDSNRGAGIWIPDKPCGLSGMTAEGCLAACSGRVHSNERLMSNE